MESARGAAHAVTEFFHGNALATPIGTQVEQATNPVLNGENWALNMTICDMVNTSEEGPRDAIRAIRKRLKDYMGKNNQVVFNTLTVLETCVKNCDRRFHQLVAQKEFAQDLVKLIGPKYDPPQAVQDRVLGLVQCWADAFRTQPDLKGVCELYEELKAKGVEFPMTDLDSMAPIYTPKKSVFTPVEPSKSVSPKPPQHSSAAQPMARGDATSTVTPVHLSPEQLAKLRSELDIVSGNVRVLQEMLTDLHPGEEDAEDFQLLQDLYNTCRQMQKRLLELLDTVANEEVTSELLVVNDELNTVFSKYDRYMTNWNRENHQSRQSLRPGGKTNLPSAVARRDQPASSSTAIDTGPALIDFGSGNDENANLSGQLAAMSVSSGGAGRLPQTTASSADFDMFDQTRGSSMEKTRGSTYHDNSTGLDQATMGLGAITQQRSQLYADDASAAPGSSLQHSTTTVREADYKEMESWLQQQSGAAAGEQKQDDASNSAGAPSATQQDKQQQKVEGRLF